MNQEISYVRVIETTKGDLKVDEVASSFKHILMHEVLSPFYDPNAAFKPLKSNRPLNLQNYKFHLSQPFTIQNTSLTAGLIDHELQCLVQADGCSHKQILIMDSSPYDQKVAQLYEKYVLVKGYSYRLASKQVKEILLAQQHILKQVEYEFKLGNGKFKPGFIGELALAETYKDSRMYQGFQAYLQFSSKTSCPIIVSCLAQGSSPLYEQQQIGSVGEGTLNSLNEIWRQISHLQASLTEFKQSKVVLYNIPLIFQSKLDSHQFSQKVVCQIHDNVLNLLSQPSISVGFDLLRYARDPHAIEYIGLLVNKFPNKILLSNGIRYKTDLSSCAGQGYLLYAKKPGLSELYRRLKKVITDEDIFRRVIFQNKWNLLAWKSKEVEIQIEVTWSCSKCGLVQSQKIQKFRKFGKQFCSIKCLKS